MKSKNTKTTYTKRSTKRSILVLLTAGVLVASATSSNAAQATSDRPRQNHQEHQQHQRQDDRQEQQKQNHQEYQGHQGYDINTIDAPALGEPTNKALKLPSVPTNLPDWMDNKDKNHIYRKRGSYNDAIYNVRLLALDLNAVAVGHAFAYEDLVTGKARDLETKTFDRIEWVLKNPPRFMPDEANISPTFGSKYGVLEQVFDWAHVLHAQTVDVLASTKLTNAQKEAEIGVA